MNLLMSFRSEMLKSKRSASFYLTIVAAALVPFLFILDIVFEGVSPENRNNALNVMIREGFGMLSVLIFPMFVMLTCTLLPQVEYRNNAWKQVFASPQTMLQVFLAKFLNVQLLVLLFLVLFSLFVALAAVLIHFMAPTLDLLNQPFDAGLALKHAGNTYVAALGICALQFWLGLRFRNFIWPMAIGFAFWFAGTLMVMDFHTPNAQWFPHSYLALSYFPIKGIPVSTVQLYSLVYMLLFLVIGFLDFRRRRMK